MLQMILKNLSTIITGLIVLIAVGLIIRKMVKDKKSGKSSCGGSCSGCPGARSCHFKDS